MDLSEINFEDVLSPAPAHETVLDEARRIVNGPRRSSYGHPKVNFQRIADMWNAYLSCRHEQGDITPIDVTMMMTLLKIARLVQNGNDRDGLVDIAGYAQCAALINGVDPA